MNEQINPCKKCGCEYPYLSIRASSKMFVVCYECGDTGRRHEQYPDMVITPPLSNTKEEAIAVWNADNPLPVAVSEQTENLERVKSNIGMTIFKFCSDRYRAQNYDFTANELTSYVRREHPEIVNDSTSRILRKLRNDGIVNYGVVGARKQGKYTLIGVQGEV